MLFCSPQKLSWFASQGSLTLLFIERFACWIVGVAQKRRKNSSKFLAFEPLRYTRSTLKYLFLTLLTHNSFILNLSQERGAAEK